MTFTEEQLKRAFEWGFYAGSKQMVDGDDGCEQVIREMITTPLWVHKTNSSLFLWSRVNWNHIRDAMLNQSGPTPSLDRDLKAADAESPEIG